MRDRGLVVPGFTPWATTVGRYAAKAPRVFGFRPGGAVVRSPGRKPRVGDTGVARVGTDTPRRWRVRGRSIPCLEHDHDTRGLPMSAEIPPAVLDALRKFDTPTICNVLELFDARPRTAGY